MKKQSLIIIIIVGAVLLGLAALNMSGIDLSKGFSFSMGAATSDNGTVNYNGKTMSVVVDAAQTWTFTQSSDCVALDENMPATGDGKATYAFTAAADGECTLVFTSDAGKTLEVSLAVSNGNVGSVRAK